MKSERKPSTRVQIPAGALNFRLVLGVFLLIKLDLSGFANGIRLEHKVNGRTATI